MALNNYLIPKKIILIILIKYLKNKSLYILKEYKYMKCCNESCI